MKKLVAPFLILFLLLVFQFYSCNSSSNNETQDENDSIITTLTKELPNVLVVEGDMIPVYSDINMKKQVFSLKSGDECKILERGKFTSVQGIQDFWYYVENNHKKGWIFGAFSSLKQNSEFEVFLREFNKEQPDTLSRSHSIHFLNGKAGFKPVQYKRLGKDHYAALFYNEILYPSVELLLVIYKRSKPIKEYSLFKGDISNCTTPEGFFTSPEFIKFTGPSCGKNVLPIKYFQILDDYSIKEVKSSIIVEKPDSLIPAIRNELTVIDASISDNCVCAVHSTIKEANVTKNFIFYTIIRDECKTTCITRNNTLIALPDSNQWMVKFEKPGGFKALYESGIPGKYILILEEYVQNHILERIERQKLYLFDPKMQTLSELNLGSESCIILSPQQYGCDHCKKHISHIEELIIKGNPVNEVVKKVSNFYYDEGISCDLIKQNTKVLNYIWVPQETKFVEKVNQ